MQWTSQENEVLEVRWREGWSASRIAYALRGRSRNSVIGRINRLNLPKRVAVTILRVAKPKRERLPRQRNRAVEIDTAPRRRFLSALARAMQNTAETPGGITLMELTSDSCRWPKGDPQTPQFRFCGASHEPGYPYCAHHAVLAYTRPEGRAGIE